MNLSWDSQKSFDLMLKSLKMNAKAIKKNQQDDLTTDAEVAEMLALNKALQDKIMDWKTLSTIIPVAQPASPIAQPAAPIAQPAIPSTTGDDNLTV